MIGDTHKSVFVQHDGIQDSIHCALRFQRTLINVETVRLEAAVKIRANRNIGPAEAVDSFCLGPGPASDGGEKGDPPEQIPTRRTQIPQSAAGATGCPFRRQFRTRSPSDFLH